MILVTGATGFVGKAVIQRLQRDNFQYKELTCRLGDATGIAEACQGATVVIHCAAERWHESLLEEVNVHGTARLGALAADVGVKRFVYVSSASPRDTEYVRSKRRGEERIASIGKRMGMDVRIVRIPTLCGGNRGPRWLQRLKLLLMGLPPTVEDRDYAVREILRAVW